MADRPVLFDTTRLLTRLKHPTPSGIDRVDLAYARHFLTGAPDRAAIGIGYFGPRILPDWQLRRLLATVEDRWKETVSAAEDPVLRDAVTRLSARGGQLGRVGGPQVRRPSRMDPLEQAMKIRAAGWRKAADAPRDAIYLHTSHLRLDRPALFGWLSARPDIRPVFFVHDLIPIDFPEYAVPGEDARHRTRMETIARHAAGVVVNSADVGRRFERHLSASGLPVPPVAVAPLGVEPAFGSAVASFTAPRPYVVVCSTIEARKNHLLLLQVWRDLACRLGPEFPALVVVGRRGWESEAAVDLLDRCPALRNHVLEVPGLSTAGLAALVKGARALLMPSFAEGYGIPVAEALSAGTPVIASDIPVHREVAGDHATFLDPLDGPGWAAAVSDLVHHVPASGSAGIYRRPTWEAHFRVVEDLLAGL